MLPFLGADLRLQVEFPLFSLATAADRPTFQLTFSTAVEYYPDFAAALGWKADIRFKPPELRQCHNSGASIRIGLLPPVDDTP